MSKTVSSFVLSSREMELELASNRPLFTGTPVRMTDPSDLYPNVYDSTAKAKLTSAYLTGKTVRLNTLC